MENKSDIEIKKHNDNNSLDFYLKTIKKAFINDPMFNYLSSNKKHRKLLIKKFFETFLKNRSDGIHLIKENACIGHWILHPQEEISILEMALKGGIFTIWNVDHNKWLTSLKILKR